MKKMRNFIMTFAIAICAMAATAQNGFNYQAVIRDANGNLLAGKQISLQISLLNGDNVLYLEQQRVTTNAYGVASVVVGEGASKQGSFSNIDWSNGNISLKTEFDPNGGTNYSVIGTTMLQSVPFAEYAKKTSAIENPKDIQIQATNQTGDD